MKNSNITHLQTLNPTIMASNANEIDVTQKKTKRMVRSMIKKSKKNINSQIPRKTNSRIK